MINNYSYKITRDQAKQRTIKGELDKIKDPKVKDMFKNFQSGYNQLCSNSINYRCQGTLPKKQINENDSLFDCLNDDGEPVGGMYIAAMYYKLINIQNDFIRSILEVDTPYINQFKAYLVKPILIQSASKREIINLEINSEISEYESFLDLISIYSNKKCYNEDGSINYLNYKHISYNFEKIEEELTKIILNGKRMFKEEQTFVVYGYESFNGNTALLETIQEKYPQELMLDDEKNELIKFLSNNKTLVNEILFSIQKLIYYIGRENYPNSMTVNDIIQTLPQFIDLIAEITNFFKENQKIKVSKIIDIYEFIEESCIDEILNNVNEMYHAEINEEKKLSIRRYFDNLNLLVNKKIFSNGIRKFISRYLCGKRFEIIYNIDQNLITFLRIKRDIWPIDIVDTEEYNKEMDQYEQLGILFKEIVSLYKFLTIKNRESKKQKNKKKAQKMI